MAVAENIPKAVERTDARSGISFFDGRFLIIGMTTIIAYVIFVRWYQGWAAWEYGTDSTHPDFKTYWMSLLYIQIAAFSALFVVNMSYVWLTRDKHLDLITPEVELRRYITLLTMLFVYAFAFIWAGSFFAEQDAAWHQVVVRDTSFTPSHIVLFYGMFPLFIVIGFTTFLYAMTRLPLYAKGFSLPLVIATTGPMMVLPNVGFNEWGHAFWFMEEFFTAPLHWGFVVFGWSILGLGGILVQVVSRLVVLIGQVFRREERGTSVSS